MMLALRLIAIAILILTVASSNDSDVLDRKEWSDEENMLIEMQERMDIRGLLNSSTAALNNVLDRIKKDLKAITHGINNSVENIYTYGKRYANAIVLSIISRNNQLTEEIKDLQAHYNESRFSKCFVASPVKSALNSAVHGVSQCVANAIDEAQTTLVSLATNINVIYESIQTFKHSAESCKGNMLEWMCTMTTNAISATRLVGAIGSITTSATTAMAYFSRLPTTFMPCAIYVANFQRYAFDALRNVTSCVNSVMTYY